MTKIRESDAIVSMSNTTIPHRRKGEIVEEILGAIKEDSVKTHCMYQSHIPNTMLNACLSLLERRGLVRKSEESGGRVNVFLTEKGEKFYEVIRCVNGTLRRDTDAEERRNLLSQLDFERREAIESQMRYVEHKYRSGDEIFHSVLNACKNPAPITHIMYASNRSYTYCKQLLNLFEECGLIKKSEPTKEYSNVSFLYHNTRQGDQLRLALGYTNKVLYSADQIGVGGLRRI